VAARRQVGQEDSFGHQRVDVGMGMDELTERLDNSLAEIYRQPMLSQEPVPERKVGFANLN